MRKILLCTTAAALTLAAVAIVRTRGSNAGDSVAHGAAAAKDGPGVDLIAAPGRVEPVSEEIRITSQIAGRLDSIRVREGDRIQRGQILATLSNADYRARVASAEAELKWKEAGLRQIVNGAREQQRREAHNVVQEAEAILENARTEKQRREVLFQQGDISRSEMDGRAREYAVAQARHDAARERLALLEAAPREEDHAKAEAEVELARARVEEAKALLDKTVIRSPIDGVVLRQHLNAGESVTDLTEVQPIVTIGDLSRLRVRAEVDETDIAPVRVGQRAWVSAAAYGDRKFRAHVVRVGSSLGRKHIHTDDPAERLDTKVLEVLLELEKAQMLPNGLRVDAYIITGKPPSQ